MHGDAVRAAQTSLGVTVDGSFGPGSQRAVAQFTERANRLNPGYFSGTSLVVGQHTWVSFFAAVQ